MVLKRELIGGKINLLHNGILGKITDETENTFVVKIEDKRKRILKKDSIFEFTLNDKNVIIDGKKLAMRPEERIRINKGGFREN